MGDLRYDQDGNVVDARKALPGLAQELALYNVVDGLTGYLKAYSDTSGGMRLGDNPTLAPAWSMIATGLFGLLAGEVGALSRERVERLIRVLADEHGIVVEPFGGDGRGGDGHAGDGRGQS